ncbi:MAG: hypothetical protein ACI4F0_06905 [Agathobacter sp.]
MEGANQNCSKGTVTLKQLTEEEKIRLQNEAREDRIRQQLDLKYYYETKFAEFDKKREKQAKEIAEQEKEIAERKNEYLEQAKELAALKKEYIEKEKQIAEQKRQIVELEQCIEKLQKQQKEL